MALNHSAVCFLIFQLPYQSAISHAKNKYLCTTFIYYVPDGPKRPHVHIICHVRTAVYQYNSTVAVDQVQQAVPASA